MNRAEQTPSIDSKNSKKFKSKPKIPEAVEEKRVIIHHAPKLRNSIKNASGKLNNPQHREVVKSETSPLKKQKAGKLEAQFRIQKKAVAKSLLVGIQEESEVPRKKKKSSPTDVMKQQTSQESNEAELDIDKTSKEKGDVKPKDKAIVAEKYPVLQNEELIQKCRKVTLTNNQKGRIRQTLRDIFKGSTGCYLPDLIHNKIQTILQGSENLTDADLRKIRILYNMLKTAIESERVIANNNMQKENTKLPKAKKKPQKEIEKKERDEVKVKGPKRYIVFVGNLPKDVNKAALMNHFGEISPFIKDIRMPKMPDNTKSPIAYLELSDESSYQMALSKHHSMLENKRINVLYTTQKKTKISKSEAKSKSAKLIAMQKAGKLVGSTALKNKRSARRKKMKLAQKKAEAE